MIRVLVCGGRDYGVLPRGCPPRPHETAERVHRERRLLFDTLEMVHVDRGIVSVIHGGATGADELAASWAWAKCIEERKFTALRNKYGASAGLRRNQQMLDEGKPDLVIAFPGGKDTADMVRRVRAAGVEVMEIKS